MVNRRWVLLLGFAAVLIVGRSILPDTGWHPGSGFQLLVEGVAALLAMAVGILVLLRFDRGGKSAAFLMLGTGFLGLALLDIGHRLLLPAAVLSAEGSWTLFRLFPGLGHACVLVGLAVGAYQVLRQAARDVLDKELASAMLQEEVTERQFREQRLRAEQRVREEVWRMEQQEDIEKVLLAVRNGLELLEIPFDNCGINIVDTSGETPVFHSHNMDQGGKWTEAVTQGGEILLDIWQRGEIHYRQDLLAEGMDRDREAVAHYFDSSIRAVVDVPFSHGTLAVNSAQPDAFSAHHISAIQGLADMLSEGFRRSADLERQARSQEELRKLALVVSRTDNGVVLTDREGHVEWVNDGFTRLTGYALEEVVGKKPGDLLLGPDSDPQTIEQMRQQLRKGEGFQVEIVNYTKSGRRYWVNIEVQPILDEQGQLVRFMGIESDITERWLAEETLRNISMLQRAILNSASYTIIATDPQGTILTFNAAAERMLGYRREEVIGVETPEIIHDPDEVAQRAGELSAELGEQVEPGFEVFTVNARRGVPDEREWTYVCKDGRRLPMQLSMTALRDDQGELTGFLGIASDITERKRAEEELLCARDEAEAANRAKSAFLANMSHELRTPLNAIIGYSEMLQEDAELEGLENFTTDLKKIHGAGKHLLLLINDILDLSKIEAGRMELFVECFGVGALIDEVIATVQPLVDRNGNALHVKVGGGVAEMEADQTKVRQILFNLLSNAAKFTEKGDVWLRVDSERIMDRDWVRFAVRDTGIGMSHEQVEKAFQAFGHADPSTTRKYGGTGLGLVITQRFCQLMGGEIGLESQPGEGSTFTVRLPATIEPASASGADERAVDDGGGIGEGSGPVVLVVDDDAAVRDLMRRFLNRQGFRVATARDGQEGLKLAREVFPMVILLDVVMPEMDGWSTLQALKADADLADIPVVLVSMLDDKSKGYALGATDFLSKPIDWPRLRGMLEKHRPAAEPGRVLIIDDEEDIRQVFGELLEQDGWEVAEAANGREGLARVAEKIPQLILLDLTMPEMDGFEFLERLRLEEGCREISVVVITGKPLGNEEILRLQQHVEQVLQKGAYERDDLLEQIRGLVKRAVAPRSDEVH